MSVRVMAWVWEHAAAVQGNDLVALLALADWADDDGMCWPSIPKLAKKARVSVRTAHNIVARLEADGWIDVEHNIGRGHSNRYTVRMLHQLSPEMMQDLHVLEEENVQSDAEIVQPPPVKHAIAVAPDPSLREPPELNHQKEKGGARARASPGPPVPFPEDFTWLTKEFWRWVDNEGMDHDWVKRRLRKYQLTFKASGATRRDWTAQVQAWLLEDRDAPPGRRQSRS